MADTRAGDLEYITTDVLVVGCGAAGARAAIGAAASGARTLVVTKSRLGKGGATPTANAADLTIDGLSAAEIGLPGDRRDSPEQFFKDIVADGLYLSNQKMVEAYVRENKPATHELLDWGMEVYSFETAHSQTYVRGINTSGKEIMQALGRRLNSYRPGWLVDHMVVDFLTTGNRISGAVVVDERYGTVRVVKCKAVVLATGGWQNGWLNNSASTDLTGDGQAMVYRAGGELVDMEMFQAMPECLLWPPAVRNSYITYILAEYGLGHLVNSEGERFMKRYDPRMLEQSTKEIISVATALEVRAGRGTPHGGVWFTMEGATAEEFNACLEDVSQYAPGSLQFRDEFPRVAREAFEGRTFEVGNVVHYMMGGIRVDESGRGSLSGLFAAGECSGGLWGANRVSSAISEAIIQGRIAGRSAGEYVAQAEQADVDPEQVETIVERAFAPLRRDRGTAPFEVTQRVKELTATYMGIVKNGTGLERVVSELTDIEKNVLPDLFVSGTASRKVNAEWLEALRLTNLVQVLGLTARSALHRDESRGSHYREDANVTDNDRWLVNIVTRSADGAPELTESPVVVTSLEPPSGRMTFEEANEVATASLTKAAGDSEDGDGGAGQ